MEHITIIIETPKGSAQKFDFDPELKGFKLNKVMPAGMFFPYDFGFIPKTKGGDGDPLDVIVLSEFKTFSGCIMDCRILGAITAEQTEKDGSTMRNDRFIVVPTVSHQYDEVSSLDALPKKILEELEHFFIAYNEISGKVFKPLDRIDASEALKIIKESGDE